MSVLSDSHGKLMALLAAVEETSRSYQVAQQSLAALDGDEPVNLEGVGMNLRFGDTVIPVPLPTDQQALADRVADAVAFLGAELVDLWDSVYHVSAAAKRHCDDAAARAQALQASPPPPAGTPQSPPQGQSPVDQHPLGPPQQPPQPRVSQVHTVPVDAGS